MDDPPCRWSSTAMIGCHHMAPICSFRIRGRYLWMRHCSTHPCPARLSLVLVRLFSLSLQFYSIYSRLVCTDCILRPDVGRPSNTTSINHVLQEGRKTLGELDSEMQSGQDDSSRLEMSREYIQQLLDGDQLTEL